MSSKPYSSLKDKETFSQSPNEDLNFQKKRKRTLLLILIPSVLLILVITIIIIVSSSSSSSNESGKGIGLEGIREEFLETLISTLPPRSSTSYESMLSAMKKIKESNSLGEAETAWFIFRWMTENIAYDCYGVNHGGVDSTATGTYTKGKSVCAGFSALFSALAKGLGLEAVYLVGYERSAVTPGSTPSSSNHAWNVVKIDGKYRFVDVTFGAGLCSGDNFSKAYVPFFFNPDPKQFIKSHFPEEEKWQLLDKTVSFSEWLDYADIYAYFFTEGFERIEPEYSLYKTNGEQTIRFYFNEEKILENKNKNVIKEGARVEENLTVTGTLYYHDYSAGKLVAQDRSMVQITSKTDEFVEMKIKMEKSGKYQIRLNSSNKVDTYNENGGVSTRISGKYIATLTFQNS